MEKEAKAAALKEKRARKLAEVAAKKHILVDDEEDDW